MCIYVHKTPPTLCTGMITAVVGSQLPHVRSSVSSTRFLMFFYSVKGNKIYRTKLSLLRTNVTNPYYHFI